MDLFFEILDPSPQLDGNGYVRAGLESDDNKKPELSFWLKSTSQDNLKTALEAIQRYTRWLDARGFLQLSAAQEIAV